MQNVKVSQNLLNSLEFDTLLTLEQAQWYTQNEGFIPLPRKSDKKNLYVIFSSELSEMSIALKKRILKNIEFLGLSLKLNIRNITLLY